MKKILSNCDFEDCFDSLVLARGRKCYKGNRILDIWYQGESVTAYIEGSEIYKVKLKINDENIDRFYCTCPYSEDGEYMCKHIAAVLYHLEENEVPKLETSEEAQMKKDKMEPSDIYEEMDYELEKISDRNGFVNYYNGHYFVDLIANVANYINNFINDKEYDKAFDLIVYTYEFIKDTFMDGSNGEYQDSLSLINESASKLLYDDDYFQIFLSYTYEVASNKTLGDFSDSPLHAFILYVHDETSAKKIVEILDEIDLDFFGIFVDRTLDKITLTYNFIDKETAIKMCYKNIELYGVKELLVEYLKAEGKIDDVIKILKDDIKNHVRKDIAYNKLISIYDEYNKLEEKKKLLPEVIIETSNFQRYKELKNMCNEAEWENLKNDIIPKIKSNTTDILGNIYMEENETEKLFELLKKDRSMYRISKYQDILKDKYSKELLEFYKPQIIEESKRISNRQQYQELCYYIKKMNELNNSENFIFDMLKEMYPNYRNKRAFKEEIINVLSPKNNQRFYELTKK